MSRVPFHVRDRVVHISKVLNSKLTKSSRSPWGALEVGKSALLLSFLFVVPAAASWAQSTFGLQPVGVASGSQNVTVNATAAGTVATVRVLTMGAQGMDFTAGSGASTCSNASLNVGSSCVQSVAFTPAAPGGRIGAVVLLDNIGNLLATALISGTGQGGLGVLVPGNVIPVAGDGDYLGQILDGDVATAAELYLPASVTLDAAGNMYIADTTHNRIRKVSASNGIITTFVGNGDAAYTGDGQVANNVTTTLNSPGGVTLDGAGNLYIADTGNNAIRVVWAATGIITTLAGNGNQGDSGDGGPAASAMLNQPWGVTVDPQGNLFIADTYNHRIRMICAVAPGTVLNGIPCPAAGEITTVAGNGFTQGNGNGGFSGDNGSATKAEMNFPYAVAFDAAENMYIPDQENNRVRMVDRSGTITTFAGDGAAAFGGDGAAAAKAQLFGPSGVAVDPAGNVYIADTQNSAIRKVSSVTGLISTLVITNQGEFLLPGPVPGQFPVQVPTQNNLHGPIGVFLDGAGDLYFADTINMVIREIQSNASVLDFTMTPVRQGELSTPLNQTLENDGNLPWSPTAITPDQNATINAAGTTCAVGIPLIVNAQCTISAQFSPSVSVPPTNFEFGNIDVASVAVNQPLDIVLVGDATSIKSTTVVVTSSLNPSSLGTSVTFTATVSTGAGTGALVGAVTFFVDGVAIPGAALAVDSNGVATYVTSTLTVGVHNITAQYMDTNGAHFDSPVSAPLRQIVIQGTGVVLVSSSPNNQSLVGASVTFTATVSSAIAGGVTPDGTVTFTDGSTILGTFTLASGVATYTTSTLTNGLHPITASYSGDVARQIQSSVSNILNQDVVQPTTVVLTSTPNPSSFGSPVTFTATVTSQSTQIPTGPVNFLNGTQSVGTANLNASGVAVFVTSALPAGTDSITAAYVDDNYNGSSTSSPVPQVVKQATTVTTLSASPTPAIAGGPIVLTASITVTQGISTPTGTVTFTSGATSLGSAAVAANGTAVITVMFAPGSQSVVATYSGDANDMASASAALPLTVQIATTTSAVTSNANPAVVLASITFTVKITGNGGIPTGTVTFSADGTAIGTETLDATGTASVSDATLVVGSHAITAVYAGDTNDATSTSAALNQVVGTIATATALGVSSAGGTTPEVILVATVVGASGPAPSGTVTFQSGSVVLGSAPVNSSGVAILAPNLPSGSENVVAIYSGDPIHAASQSVPVSVSSVPLDFSVTVTPSTIKIATGSSTVVSVALASYSGFTDTIGLGCASLPAAVNCHFSTITEPLVANGTQTVQLTIDTNNPLGGGTSTTASAERPGAAKALIAGLTLPLSLFFGCLFWRLRKRHGAVFTALAVVLFGLSSMAMTACSGFTQISAAPGTYVIQVTGTGNNSDVEHYQNVSITITQ